MPERIHELLARTQRSAMVGRADEQAAFRRRLTDAEPPAVHFVVGPGGIGKSTLLRLLAQSARELGWHTIELDCRDIEPTALAVTQACVRDGGGEDLDAWLGSVGDRPTVFVFDSYETLASLDGWVRGQFLPMLPTNTHFVFGSRYLPGPDWISQWGELIHTLPLRNLDRNEARELLRRRAVPDSQHGSILDFTHGHPLALSLVAELFHEDPGLLFAPAAAPAAVHHLVETLMDSVVDGHRRAGIEVSALVRVVTEALLEATIPQADAAALFRWLAQRSFMESHMLGIAPHDLARDAITADLRWRNPERYLEWHDRARSYYRAVLASRPNEQSFTLMDYVYLHRDSPFVKPFMDFSVEGRAHVDRLHPEDHATIRRMVELHEGPGSAAVVWAWLGLAPGAFTVLRGPDGAIAAFWLAVELQDYEPGVVEFDALTAAAMAHARLRGDERGILFRSWMAVDSYQDISSAQSRIFIEFVRRYLTTPRLAQSYVVCTDPDFWEPLFTYADFRRHRELETGEGGGVYGHDWRSRPPIAWLDLLAAREVAAEPDLSFGRPTPELVLLSERDFRAAVFDALRNYKRVDALERNPLLRSSLIERNSAGLSRVATLQSLIRRVVDEVTEPEDHAKLHPVLYHGFLNPAPTHEAAARLAHVSYSTFRRYAERGRNLVADRLWSLELDPTST